VECGTGYRERTRGNDTEQINCWAGLCAGIGFWSEWSAVENNCELTCGGSKIRKRHCINGVPREGGCQGDPEERIECEPCGAWGTWNNWSKCSQSCSQDSSPGIQSRTRSCENGKCKKGEAEEITSCNLNLCPNTTIPLRTRTTTTTTRRTTTTGQTTVQQTTEQTTTESYDTEIIEDMNSDMDRVGLPPSIILGQATCTGQLVPVSADSVVRYSASSVRQADFKNYVGKDPSYGPEMLMAENGQGWCGEFEEYSASIEFELANYEEIHGIRVNAVVDEYTYETAEGEVKDYQRNRYPRIYTLEYFDESEWQPMTENGLNAFTMGDIEEKSSRSLNSLVESPFRLKNTIQTRR